MLPMFLILGWIATGLGVGSLIWYETMTPEQKKAADQLACGLAKKLYNKTLDQLTKDQFNHVQGIVRGHFSDD